jgi:lipid II:glycine glycyltransferase (peptidoglycan interpeptide bridge formation enzyme)
MGDRAEIRLLRQNGAAIAAMLTLQHRSCVVYKYGCSEEKFHNLGCMPFLFWRLIEESKMLGAKKIDFGRSDWNNQSLIDFKNKFGTVKKAMTYYLCTNADQTEAPKSWHLSPLRRVCSVLPGPILSAAGRILYRHMG